MKIRSTVMLQDALDRDFSWRIKEIANLGLVLRTARGITADTYVRAAVPLLYAHWEGFIKCAATCYANFVLNQRHTFDALSECFIVLGLNRHLDQYQNTKKTEIRVDLVKVILNENKERAAFNPDNAGDTKSNLSSDVFEQIAIGIGIDAKPYQSRYHLIDESLLKRRNMIAHGEHLAIDADGYRTLADDVLQLMRCFKTDIQNAASLKQYLRI